MVIAELIDPFADSFEFKSHEFEFRPNCTLSDFFPELEEFTMLVNDEEVPSDYIIQEDDMIVFTPYVGGKVGGYIALAVAVIALAIATWGAGLAIAGAVAASGTAMGSIGAAGALITMEGIASTVVAGMTVGTWAQIGLMAAMMAFSLLSQKSGLPSDAPTEKERSVYLWGQNKTQSKVMAPIPILCGKFPLYGNLVAARSETINVKDYTHPMIDIGYFEFVLCANPITRIDEIYLNKLKANTMDDEDLSMFYLAGSEDQGYLCGITEGSQEENGVYRFNDLDNDPLSLGEAIVPGNITEKVWSHDLIQPTHLPYDDFVSPVSNIAVQIGTPTFIEFLGKCDENGNLLPEPNLDQDDKDEADAGTLYILIAQRKKEKIVIEDDPDNTGMSPYTSHEEWVYPSGSYIEELEEVYKHTYLVLDPGYNPLDYMSENDPTQPDYTRYFGSPQQVMKIQYISTIDAGTDKPKFLLKVLTFDARRGTIVPDNPGFFSKTVHLNYSKNYNKGYKHPWYVDYEDESNVSPPLETESIYPDEIIYQLYAKSGMWTSFMYKASKQHWREDFAWITLEWKVIEYRDDGTIRACMLSSKGRPNYWCNPWDNLYPGYKPGLLGIKDFTKFATIYTVKLTDIITHPLVTDHPDYGAPTYGRPQLENGKLTGRRYLVTVRIVDHGYWGEKDSPILWKPLGINGELLPTCRSYGQVNDSKFNHNFSPADKPDSEKIHYDITLYRTKEIKYTNNITYPNKTCLGMAFKASESQKDQMPQISVLARNKILVWDAPVVDGEIDWSTVEDFSNHWTYKHSRNPAYICLDLLFNSYYGACIGGYGSSSPQGSPEFNEKVAEFCKAVDVKKFCKFALYCDDPVSTIAGLEPKTSEPSGLDDPDEWVGVNEGEITMWYPKRHVFNGLIDTEKSVLDVINRILQGYDAQVFFSGDAFSLYYNDERYLDDNLVPVQLFTSSTIKEGSFIQSFLNPTLKAHILETSYLDENNFYEKTPVIYMPYDMSQVKVNQKTTVDLFGYTNKHRVIHQLHKILRITNFMTQVVEFDTATQGLSLQIGDLIGVTHEYIEWGASDIFDLKTSGRVLKTEGDKVYLDKVIKQEQSTVNLAGYFILMQAVNDDSARVQAKIKSSVDTQDFTILTLEQPLPFEFPIESIYILGRVDELYKDWIVTDLTMNVDTVKVKAVEFNPDLFSPNMLITDIFAGYFNADDCKPRNLEASCDLDHFIVSWSPPKFLASKKDNEYQVSLVKYLIYYKSFGDIWGSSYESKWSLIGETTNTNFIAENPPEHYTKLYKIVPVVKINGNVMYIPTSWCDSVELVCDSTIHDYLKGPKVTRIEVSEPRSGIEDVVDINIYFERIPVIYKEQDNWIGLWTLFSETNSENWLGPRNIQLTRNVHKHAKELYVNTIDGLPTRNGKVFGLLVVDNNDIIMVTNSQWISSSEYRLDLVYHDDLALSRRYALFDSYPATTQVVSAHYGFWPVRYFATHEHNGLDVSPAESHLVFNTIYRFDPETNQIILADPTQDEEVWKLQQTSASISKYYTITSGKENVISYPSTLGVTEENKFFMEVGKKSKDTNEFEINWAWMVNNGWTHDIFVAGLNRMENYKKLAYIKDFGDSEQYITLADVPTQESGTYTWVGIQHAREDHDENIGYTSYIPLVEVL